MDARQSFQIGFLTYCADAGLSGDQARALAEKAAALAEKRADGLDPLGAMKSVGRSPLSYLKANWPWLLGGAVVVPGLAGGLAGHLAANAAHGNDFDEDDVKTQERIELLRLEARKARAMGAA